MTSAYPTKLILGTALLAALLGGCNRHNADQNPNAPAATPESTTPATTPSTPPSTTPPSTTPDNSTTPSTTPTTTPANNQNQPAATTPPANR